MKIIKLRAENIKRLKAVEIVPDGNVIKITGRNEQGKTSVLDAIWWALGGTRNIPEQPIRVGETQASVMLDLGDLVVTRTFTPTGSYLKVESKNGMSFKSPQAILDRLVGKLSFDPLEFARSDKAKQVETLLSVIDLRLDMDKLFKIAGCAFPVSNDPLVTLNNAYKIVYDMRTATNRDLDRATKTLQTMPVVEETHPVSVVELVKQRDLYQLANQENEAKRKKLAEEELNLARVDEEIAETERRIRELQEHLDYLISTRKDVAETVEQRRKEVALLRDVDLQDIDTAIAAADETNRRARAWQEREQAAARVRSLEDESNEYTRRLELIKAYKTDLISNAKFPIDGLSFGEDGIEYKGIPFEQVSSAQKLEVSLSVAMALNPELRVIRIDNGSLLDSEHLSVIEKVAQDKDFQIWIEMVEESGQVGIYIEDGEVRSVNGGKTDG